MSPSDSTYWKYTRFQNLTCTNNFDLSKANLLKNGISSPKHKMLTSSSNSVYLN